MAQWLHSLGLEQYVPLFQREKVDTERLSAMTYSEWKRLVKSYGHRKTMLQHLLHPRD